MILVTLAYSVDLSVQAIIRTILRFSGCDEVVTYPILVRRSSVVFFDVKAVALLVRKNESGVIKRNTVFFQVLFRLSSSHSKFSWSIICRLGS